MDFEVLFHNRAFLKLLENEQNLDLDSFIQKPVFSLKSLNHGMSLAFAATNRFSDEVL